MKTFYNPHLLFSSQKKSAPLAQCLALLLIIAWPYSGLFAQAPVISYSTPQTYAVGVAIKPLLPVNTGGAVGGLGFSSTATTLRTGISDATCMVMDKSGNMYIGESSGKVSMLARGARSAAAIATGFSPVAGIAVDASYNVYVADGAFVWKIAAIGHIKSRLGSFRQPAGVALDAAGNLYVADPCGSGLGGVFKMAADGTAQVRIDNRQAVTIAPDRKGNLFFTSGGSVFELPAGGTEKSLPVFLNAMGVATDLSGNIYVAYEIGGSTAFCMLPASGGLQTMLKPTIPGLAVQVGLMVDANFNLYAASGSIMKMSAAGGYFISPELPPGLTLNPTNGDISGTPIVPWPAANYTVKAFNASGSSTATLNIRLSADADLNAFNAGIGPLTPSFSANTAGYTLNVGYAASSITVRPVSRDTNATMTLNGTPVTSGTASRIALAEGQTAIIVIVTAPDRLTTKTYTLMVNRPVSNNADLNAVNSSAGPLTPEFSANTTGYTINVSNATASMTMRPVSSDANATMTLNGTPVTSGTTPGPIALAAGGQTTITVIVTAPDRLTTKTYTFIVNRVPSGDDGYNPQVGVTDPNHIILPADDGIKVHQGVSPNGDGIDDFLQIDNISQYPDNKLSIMNRSGQMVYEAKGYDNSAKVFDGHSNRNGQIQLPGTYFYQLDYSVNGITKHKTGFLVLRW